MALTMQIHRIDDLDEAIENKIHLAKEELESSFKSLN
jgi:hypothetical protein